MAAGEEAAEGKREGSGGENGKAAEGKRESSGWEAGRQRMGSGERAEGKRESSGWEAGRQRRGNGEAAEAENNKIMKMYLKNIVLHTQNANNSQSNKKIACVCKSVKGGVKVHKLQQKMHHNVIFLCKNLVGKHKKHTFAAEKHENRRTKQPHRLPNTLKPTNKAATQAAKYLKTDAQSSRTGCQIPRKPTHKAAMQAAKYLKTDTQGSHTGCQIP
ncbi:MAG: hypothetical protein IJS59_05770 [Bacteroidaceae bacterium]|nr:hypothetical protein [Bacteroidaceae bacterium]